jgi:hypothetical protein
MMRRSLIALTTLGLIVVPAACGSDDDTDVTTPDVTVPTTAAGSEDSLDDPTMTVPMDTTMSSTGDTIGGVEGTASNGDTTTP